MNPNDQQKKNIDDNTGLDYNKRHNRRIRTLKLQNKTIAKRTKRRKNKFKRIYKPKSEIRSSMDRRLSYWRKKSLLKQNIPFPKFLKRDLNGNIKKKALCKHMSKELSFQSVFSSKFFINKILKTICDQTRFEEGVPRLFGQICPNTLKQFKNLEYLDPTSIDLIQKIDELANSTRLYQNDSSFKELRSNIKTLFNHEPFQDKFVETFFNSFEDLDFVRDFNEREILDFYLSTLKRHYEEELQNFVDYESDCQPDYVRFSLNNDLCDDPPVLFLLRHRIVSSDQACNAFESLLKFTLYK